MGDRAHVAKKEKKMNFKQGQKRDGVGTKRRVIQLYVPKKSPGMKHKTSC
ncbi:hypothetical protein NDI40_24190 [Microcoleus vaginatus ZQ-A3]